VRIVPMDVFTVGTAVCEQGTTFAFLARYTFLNKLAACITNVQVARQIDEHVVLPRRNAQFFYILEVVAIFLENIAEYGCHVNFAGQVSA